MTGAAHMQTGVVMREYPKPSKRTEHWWRVCGFAIQAGEAGLHPEPGQMAEVRGRIAMLFTQLPKGWQDDIAAHARQLTSTNCGWMEYRVGEVVLDPKGAIAKAKART